MDKERLCDKASIIKWGNAGYMNIIIKFLYFFVSLKISRKNTEKILKILKIVFKKYTTYFKFIEC